MLRSALLVAALISASMGVSGCATSQTVTTAPVTAGTSKEFAAGFDVVKAAALEAVERMNVDVQGSDENAERFQIRFSKPVSAFSWGEVGVVNVVRVDDATTRVVVNAAKRSQMQVTGTSEAQFASQIFKNLDEGLARLRP